MMYMTPFRLVYDSEIPRQLCAIDRKHHSLIRSTIEQQLSHDPDVETANRKPLKRPVAMGARWELRFGPQNRFRVYYQVHRDVHEVRVLAIGVKYRTRVYIDGEEYKL